MKLKPALLAIGTVCIALYAPAPLRAGDTWATFPENLAVPLSRAETKKFESLLRAEKTADVAHLKSSAAHSAASAAADAAAPTVAAPLRKKADALYKLTDADFKRYAAANDAVQKFKASKRAQMPGEVRQTRPRSATSVYLGRHRMGAGGQLMLVHLWTWRRKAGKNSPTEFVASPFHLDVFQSVSLARAGKVGQAGLWRRVSSTAYQAHDAPDPDTVAVHYLRVAARQSPVLLLASPSHNSVLCTVVTYPRAWEGDARATCRSSIRADPLVPTVTLSSSASISAEL